LKENNEIRKAGILNDNDTAKGILSSTGFKRNQEGKAGCRDGAEVSNQPDEHLQMAKEV